MIGTGNRPGDILSKIRMPVGSNRRLQRVLLPKNGKIDYVSASSTNKIVNGALSAPISRRKNVNPATGDIRLLGNLPNRERLIYYQFYQAEWL